jgi:hypothetical protein
MNRNWQRIAVAGLFAWLVTAPGVVAAQPIVVDDSSGGCTRTGNWADNVRNNPEGKNFSPEGLVGGVQHYTSSHGKYRRTGKEEAVFKASLPKSGRYTVEITWRRSSNRSSKVTWEVRHAGGTTRKTISQRGDSYALQWFSLGTYEFGQEGVVAMVDDGGQSASIDAARFTPGGAGGTDDTGNTGSTTKPGTTSPGNLDDVVNGGGADEVSLDGNTPGTRTFTFPKDSNCKVSACLLTRGPAKIKVVKKAADGTETTWMVWNRQDDRDSSRCQVEGSDVPDSMFEQNPGDFSPKPVERSVAGKKGDRLILTLEGDFQGEAPYLRARPE